jgi:hypothetical protein
MRLNQIVMAAVLVIFLSGVEPGDPGQWALYQNQPDPFYNGLGSEGTEFRCDLRQYCRAALRVWDEPMSLVVRDILPDGWYEAGRHGIKWDGLNETGGLLSEGTYPYTLIARDSLGNVLFADTLELHILGSVKTAPTSWGQIKGKLFD